VISKAMTVISTEELIFSKFELRCIFRQPWK
jgi:hypothetical protein